MVYAAVFVLRALNLEREDPEEWKEVDFLMPGDTADLKDSFAGDVLDILGRALGQPADEEKVLRIMGIRRTNANAMSAEGKQGNLLYPVYALMNSNCYSNTFYTLTEDEEEGGGRFKMEVRAQVDIAEGEEITTRYVCSFDCLPGRQVKIWQNWRFLCRCRRCSDPTDLGTYFSALRCRACSGGEGFLLPAATDVLNPPWRCDSCGHSEGPRHVTERLSECQRLVKEGLFASRPAELWERLSRELHPNHFLMCTLRQKRFFVRDRFDPKVERDLEDMVATGERLLEVVTAIDPGFTKRRGRILKVLAKDRMMLARLRRELRLIGEKEFKSALRVAAAECKTMALCFLYG